MKKGTLFLFGFFVGAVLSAELTRRHYAHESPDTATTVDTVVYTDTVVLTEPVSVHDTLVHYIATKPVVLRDTVSVVVKEKEVVYTNGDSVLIPISQKRYSDDTTYTAWVSGYSAQLDSIHVYQRTTVMDRKSFVKVKRRWALGIQGGYYLTPSGFQPGIGLGVSYGLW